MTEEHHAILVIIALLILRDAKLVTDGQCLVPAERVADLRVALFAEEQ